MLGVREDNETARLYDSLPFSPFASSLIIRANMLYIYPAIWTGFWMYNDPAKIQLAASFPDLVPQRSLFVDAVLAEQNAKQAVILGAGFDMRAYGQHGKKMKFFEVDFEVTQTAKLDSLAAAGIDASDISFVSVDVRNEEWVDQLLKSGFTKDAQTIFILEGLIYYLQKDKVRQLFDFASECAQGSIVVFDYLHTRVVRGEQHSYIKKILEIAGEPLLFGVEEDPSTIMDWASALGFGVKRWQNLPSIGGVIALEVVEPGQPRAYKKSEKGTPRRVKQESSSKHEQSSSKAEL